MKMHIQALHRLLEPVVSDAGYELWGVEHTAGSGRPLVRVYIDKAAGITLDDCELVSRRITGLLDVEDPVPGPYDLEVSSPGLDRPLFTLEQFQRFAGHEVSVRLRGRIDGRRRVTGRIGRVEQDAVEIIEAPDQSFTVPVDAIEKARLIPDL